LILRACIAENELNVSFNVKKSAIVRIGPAFRHLCACVNLKGCAQLVPLTMLRLLDIWVFILVVVNILDYLLRNLKVPSTPLLMHCVQKLNVSLTIWLCRIW